MICSQFIERIARPGQPPTAVLIEQEIRITVVLEFGAFEHRVKEQIQREFCSRIQQLLDVVISYLIHAPVDNGCTFPSGNTLSA